MGIISLAVSLLCGLFAAICMLYMCVFVIDVRSLLELAPVEYTEYINHMATINHKPDWNKFSLPLLQSLPILNNILLVCLFGLQHSAMQRGPVKMLLGCFVSESNRKTVYVFASAVCLFAMFLLWIPMTSLLWDITHPTLKLVVYAVALFAIGGTAFSLLNLDPLQMLGISVHLGDTLKWKKEKSKTVLITTGLYGLMRHPVYTFSLMILWVTPYMTVGHCLLASLFTAYVVFAVAWYEEPDLVKEFGPDYVEYMKTTPRFVPGISLTGRHKQA